MEAMRQSWTDDRLDDLSRTMEQRFDQVDQRFDQVDRRFEHVDATHEALRKEIRAGDEALRVEMKDGFRDLRSDLKEEIGELRQDSRLLHNDLLSLQHTMIRIGGAMLVALMGLLLTQV